MRRPWDVLHPSGNVHNLIDALSHEYDQFYHEQPKVSFSSCQLGYLTSEEGPQNVNTYGESNSHQAPDDSVRSPDFKVQQSFQYRGPWSVWK